MKKVKELQKMDIYNIPVWTTATAYTKNSIILVNNAYYYALVDHTSAALFSTDLNNNKWGGILTYNGESKPYFLWKPSYNYRIPIKPLVKTIRFGDGYSQDLADGISNNLLTLNLQFDNRDLDEITAILHFLNTRKNERFFFVPPQPYGIVKKFVCAEFDSTQGFYQQYSVNATFEERI